MKENGCVTNSGVGGRGLSGRTWVGARWFAVRRADPRRAKDIPHPTEPPPHSIIHPAPPHNGPLAPHTLHIPFPSIFHDHVGGGCPEVSCGVVGEGGEVEEGDLIFLFTGGFVVSQKSGLLGPHRARCASLN